MNNNGTPRVGTVITVDDIPYTLITRRKEPGQWHASPNFVQGQRCPLEAVRLTETGEWEYVTD